MYRGITLGRGAVLGAEKVEIVIESEDGEVVIVSRLGDCASEKVSRKERLGCL